MIRASLILKEFIRSQKSIESFADDMDVTRQTIYNILGGDKVSSDMVAKILNKTGMEFEKAFEIGSEE